MRLSFSKLLVLLLAGILVGDIVRSSYLISLENDVVKTVNSHFRFEATTLHSSIRALRTFVLENYLRMNRSDQETALWYATRPILRQSALDSLTGRPVYCGESSRVMIALLRDRGIRARRIYLDRDYETNHVVFEYQNPETGRWILINSLIDNFLSPLLKEPRQVEEVLRDQTQPYTTFYRIQIAGHRFTDPPYFVSVLIDSPYLIRIIVAGFLLLILVAVSMWISRKHKI